MKQISQGYIDSALGLYNAEILDRLKGWISDAKTARRAGNLSYPGLAALDLERSVPAWYKEMLNNPQIFISLTPEKYAKIEKDFGITAENRASVIKLFNGSLYKTHFGKIRKTFFNALGTKMCPYCNMDVIYQDKKNSLSGETDHYFVKSDYPLLSVFFYNLVPSCHGCNCSTKRAQPEKHANPYFHDMDAESKFIIKDYQAGFMGALLGNFPPEDYNIDLQINDAPENWAANSNNIFQLQARYNSDIDTEPKEVVLETLKRLDENNKYRREGLKHFGTTNNIHDAMICIIGLSGGKKQINQKRYSKLKLDIVEEYGPDILAQQ